MFVKFDSLNKKCGYVQGMNFIAGEFCYHSCAEISFCIFVKLMQKYQIIDNYTEGLQGLHTWYFQIEFLLRRNLPWLAQFFDKLHISTQEIVLEIIMSLFGTLIPFDHLTPFYEKFIEKGWMFFNHLIVEFLREI